MRRRGRASFSKSNVRHLILFNSFWVLSQAYAWVHNMHTLKLVSSLVILAVASEATIINRPAIKDSTILRSTVSCTACPDNDCYKCTYGLENNLRANTGGLAWIRSLVGFQLPEGMNPSAVTQCTVQFPAFTRLPQYDINLTVVPAVSSDWDEETVNGNNAPASTDDVSIIPVPALTNPPLIDVTNACQGADEDGQFSIYVGADFGSFEIWSKDSGNPAVLHITHGEDSD
ncbi:hypothetical protein BJX64DRAFT_260680 [Aspergillus heterothallicus]